MNPCFLISYSHFDAQNDSERLIRRFFDDLNREVKALGFREGGFMDEAGIQMGNRWENRLKDALERSPVMVPLCSPNYFQSHWCGREWRLFEERYTPQDGEHSYIIPVIWIPTDSLSRYGPAIQFNHRSCPEVYRDEGIRRMMKLRRHDEAYADFVHALARRVAAPAAGNGAGPWPVRPFPEVEPRFPDTAPPASPAAASPEAPPPPAPPDQSGLARLGLGLVAAANVISFLGASAPALRLVRDVTGLKVLSVTASLMTYLTGAIFAAGFVLAGAAAARFLLGILRARGAPGALPLAALAMIMIMAAGVANARYMLAPAALGAVADNEIRKLIDGLSNRFLVMQASSGGLRFIAANQETQAWTTAQAETALLAAMRIDPALRQHGPRARRGFEYIEQVRFPTGWAYSDLSPRETARTVTEIAGWVVVANAMSLAPEIEQSVWRPSDRSAVLARMRRDMDEILRRQYGSGGFSPVVDPRMEEAHARTYSTVMALWAMNECWRVADGQWRQQLQERMTRAAGWLLNQWDPVLGWTPNPFARTEVFPGLDAHALLVLSETSTLLSVLGSDPRLRAARSRFLNSFDASARAASNHRLHDSEQLLSKLDFRLEGSTFLWYPWTLAACAQISRAHPDAADVALARRCVVDLGLKADEVRDHIEKEYMYVWSENIFAAALASGLGRE